MTILVDNTLSGPVGDPVSNTSLAATSTTGTVTIAAPGPRAVYDGTEVAFTLPTVRVQSGHHRAETPRLRVDLPATGPWSARWYTWMPRLQDAGYGIDEVRSVAVFPDLAWVVHATAAGNAGTRLHAPDLATDAIGWTTEDGSPVSTGRWWRVEMAWDGTDLVSQVFAGHSTTGARIHTWAGLPDPGRTLDLTGYRWRRRPTLYPTREGWPENPPGDTADLQNELIDLGYDLSPWGADDDYGSVTKNAVIDFQTTYGLAIVDGIAGPETRAAIDLALGTVPPPLWVSHLAVSDGAWIGPATAPPEPVPLSRLRVGLPI